MRSLKLWKPQGDLWCICRLLHNHLSCINCYGLAVCWPLLKGWNWYFYAFALGSYGNHTCIEAAWSQNKQPQNKQKNPHLYWWLMKLNIPVRLLQNAVSGTFRFFFTKVPQQENHKTWQHFLPGWQVLLFLCNLIIFTLTLAPDGWSVKSNTYQASNGRGKSVHPFDNPRFQLVD